MDPLHGCLIFKCDIYIFQSSKSMVRVGICLEGCSVWYLYQNAFSWSLNGDNHPSSVDCHLFLIRSDGGYQTGHWIRDGKTGLVTNQSRDINTFHSHTQKDNGTVTIDIHNPMKDDLFRTVAVTSNILFTYLDISLK